MWDIKNTWIDFKCPKCGYIIDARLIDVKIEAIVSCYCCKTWITLIDFEGSTHVGLNSIETALNDLEKMLKKFGK